MSGFHNLSTFGLNNLGVRSISGASNNGLLTNLVAYWGLDEAAGANNALDKHTGALTLTQTGSPGAAVGQVYDTARTFDGATQSFSRTHDASVAAFASNATWSVAAWIYVPSDTGNKTILSKDGATRGPAFYRNGLGIRVTLPDIVDVGPPSMSATVDAWNLAIVTHDATTKTLQISVNGNTFVSTEYAGTPASNTNPLTIGIQNATNFYNGRIGPLSLWSDVLTGNEVAALYNMGAGLTYAAYTE